MKYLDIYIGNRNMKINCKVPLIISDDNNNTSLYSDDKIMELQKFLFFPII